MLPIGVPTSLISPSAWRAALLSLSACTATFAASDDLSAYLMPKKAATAMPIPIRTSNPQPSKIIFPADHFRCGCCADWSVAAAGGGAGTAAPQLGQNLAVGTAALPQLGQNIPITPNLRRR